jgi:2-keto-4-pentenoate hydratase/2-oxohepta-3-ene-1,7-dioic acid hydratase in catechol pathway
LKLITYRKSAETIDRVGALISGETAVVDLSDHFSSMLALVDGGPSALSTASKAVSEARRVIPLAELHLRAPLPEPRQMRDFMSFEKHYQQSINAVAKMRAGVFAPIARWLGIAKIPAVWYEQPIYYKCNRFSVNGPEQDVIWPSGAKLMDYECEIGVVIGKTGKDIPREKAMDHIFGYTIFNDMTARDLQFHEMNGRLGPAKGKDFDTGNVMGPWLVTKDEIVDPYVLTMVARVNGEEQGRGFSGDMAHRWEDIIAHVSRNETLYAGEFLGSGTVGNGCGLEMMRFLKPGSVIELEITGLGTLRNRLVLP